MPLREWLRWARASAYLLADKQASRRGESARTEGSRIITAKAKSVIFLFMDGGASQMDSFDPKPRLRQDHGKPHPDEDADDGLQHRRQSVWVRPSSSSNTASPGAPVSDLFPHVATCVDDLTIVRSMVSDHSEHTAANYFMHSGSGFQGRPSMGGWVVYGLGSECKNLPGFIVLESGLDSSRRARSVRQRLSSRELSGHAVPQRRSIRSPT